jgi:hypothetical protein
MGGFDVSHGADPDEAVGIPSKPPIARIGMREVTPFWT